MRNEPPFQATPKLSEDKVRQCVDGRLGGDYPPKAVAKVINKCLDNQITVLPIARWLYVRFYIIVGEG